MLTELVIPEPVLPQNPAGYALPTSTDVLLTWEFVAQQMSAAEYYWVSTSGKDGQTHSVPLWGIWFRNRVHVEGSPKTKWIRNLLSNPKVSVHLPSAEQVVMIEGEAHLIGDNEINEATWSELDTAYQTKYKVTHGSPYCVIHPRKVIAWDNPSLNTMTRWIFE